MLRGREAEGKGVGKMGKWEKRRTMGQECDATLSVDWARGWL